MTPINSQFLEFWGTFLLNAARGQKQLEQMSSWLKKGFPSGDELSDVFKKYYGLTASSDNSVDSSAEWQQAVKNFEEAFRQYAELWGWIPRTAYEELQSKCETLEKTIKKQAQTIDQLRKLLEAKGLGNVELMERFQAIVKEQSEEFQSLMTKLGQAFSKSPTEDH